MTGLDPEKNGGFKARDWDLLSLVREASPGELATLMDRGTAPELSELAGWEFAGLNTATIAEPFRKFKKGFYLGPDRSKSRSAPTPFIQGYNVLVAQDGIDRPHRELPTHQNPKRHGFFRVHPVQKKGRDRKYPSALLLDYGLGANGLDPSRVLRDYLVQVYPGDPTLLLGHAFVALGKLRVGVSHFVLERRNRHAFHG